ncbi:uncharacterized protein LOC110713237 isoform X2 [Chenopodium quinoa]|nr:uncharacterized protein LOC110713237 isoform X2 [Chenopodium quinoa]
MIPTNIKDMTSVSSVPMANLVKMRHQNIEKKQVGQGLQGTDSTQRKIQLGKFNARKNLSSHSQQEKEVELGKGVQAKIAQILPKKKRTRGPTMCKDVHEWTLEERKLIVLNEMGNPIGPDDKTVDTFTRFLGTLARNASLAPLNKINWHHVKDKDEIWNYVKYKRNSLSLKKVRAVYCHPWEGSGVNINVV